MAMQGPVRRYIGPDKSKIEGANIDWRLLRQVVRLARPYSRNAAAFGAATVASSALIAVPPLLFRAVIDEAVPQHDLALLTKLSLGAMALILIRSLLTLVARWQSAYLGNGIVFQLRRRLFEHTHRMPVGFFVRTQTGALMSRLNTDVQGAQQVLSSVIGVLCSNVTQLASVVGAMAFIDIRLTALVMTVVPAFLVITRAWAKIIQRITRDRLEMTASMNAFVTERLSPGGAQLVHLYGDFAIEYDEFDRLATDVRKITIKTTVLTASVALLVGLATSIATAALYGYGGVLSIHGAMSVGTVVLFAAYAERVYSPLNDLTSIRVDVMTAMVSFDRVFEILDFPNPIDDRPGAIDLVDPTGRVEFDDVSFRYPPPSQVTLASLENPGLVSSSAVDPEEAERRDQPQAEVLHDLVFEAAPGTTVALVGPTGAGKTTTLNLVSRLLDATSGRVLVDGHDVRDLTLDSLRAAIGVVSQDSHLFHDTLRNNLRYAKVDATDEELERACRIARIHDLIAGLPEGYDTVAGERGLRLSGGEKQRLSIARMILKDPTIVILDEATAHLDSTNERLIQEALAEALAGRTTLVIAHRLSTIVNADEIVVLDHGRIVQRGPHRQLVLEPGLYRQLAAAYAADDHDHDHDQDEDEVVAS